MVHQVKLCYDSCAWNTYKNSFLAAEGLLGARSIAKTCDGDRRAADGEERADDGDAAGGHSQEPRDQIGVGLRSLRMNK